MQDFNFQVEQNGHWLATFTLQREKHNTVQSVWENTLQIAFYDRSNALFEGSELPIFESSAAASSHAAISVGGCVCKRGVCQVESVINSGEASM